MKNYLWKKQEKVLQWKEPVPESKCAFFFKIIY